MFTIGHRAFNSLDRKHGTVITSLPYVRFVVVSTDLGQQVFFCVCVRKT